MYVLFVFRLIGATFKMVFLPSTSSAPHSRTIIWSSRSSAWHRKTFQFLAFDSVMLKNFFSSLLSLAQIALSSEWNFFICFVNKTLLFFQSRPVCSPYWINCFVVHRRQILNLRFPLQSPFFLVGAYWFIFFALKSFFLNKGQCNLPRFQKSVALLLSSSLFNCIPLN